MTAYAGISNSLVTALLAHKASFSDSLRTGQFVQQVVADEVYQAGALCLARAHARVPLSLLYLHFCTCNRARFFKHRIGYLTDCRKTVDLWFWSDFERANIRMKISGSVCC
jgi:hypothetical protein